MSRLGLVVIVAMFVALSGCSDDTATTTNNNTTPTNNGTTAPTNNALCTDFDDDGALAGEGCEAATDCDDNDDTRAPGIAEVCGDKKDNDCDGAVDNGCPCMEGSIRLCSSYIDPLVDNVGVTCQPGVQYCENGNWSEECVGEVGPDAELCDGLDNNCDGQVDEGLLNPVGQCLEDFPTPPDEDCGPTDEGNGLDDNGDGQVDEGCSCAVPAYDPDLPRENQNCYSGPPQTLGVGVCSAGRRNCMPDGMWEACTGDTVPGAEVCGDQLDNDCDGLVDEGCPTCVTPEEEVCDGIDNNCDGVVDEGVRNACGGCGLAEDNETCGDGLDNDCNGQIDEGCGCTAQQQQCFPGAAESAGVGTCTWGTQVCAGEYFGTCTGFVLPGLELCGPDGKGNGLDEDCDGVVDNGCGCAEGSTRLCGDGAGTCEYGTQLCTNGEWGACTGGVGPIAETCDTADNDCDGLTDEGLLNACGTCGMTCYFTGFDPTNPGFDNMIDGGEVITAMDPDNPTNRDGVTLSKTTSFLPYLWAANSNEDTASKFNTVTEMEEGRYWVGDNPSRTAVDLNGNMWIGGRNDGRLTQIMADKTSCPDRNNNGVIDTSNGTNVVNSAADPFADECVIFSQVMDAANPSIRGVAVDPMGRIWFGYSTTVGGISYIDPNNNYAVGPHYVISNVPEFSPNAQGVLTATGNTVSDNRVYGLAIDGQGYLYAPMWSWNGVVRFNTNTLQFEAYYSGLNCGAYGVAIDADGLVFTGCWNGDGGISIIDPANNMHYNARVPVSVGSAPAAKTVATIGTAASHQKWFSSAVAVEPATGNAWVSFVNGLIGRLSFDPANPTAAEFTFLSGVQDPANTATRMANTGSGNMRGVGFDSDGYLWHLGIPTANILKFDPATNDFLRLVSLGSGGHYTYSDFTGSAAFNFTAPRGFWRMTFETGFAGAQVDGVYLEAYVPAGTELGIRIRGLDAAGTAITAWLPATNYFMYPAGAANHTVNLASNGGPLIGDQFEVEVFMSTMDRDVRPILHDLRLDWQRP